MRKRGEAFWEWADPSLHARSYDERAPNGMQLNVLVRMSTSGKVQLFVGVYTVRGMMFFEEAFYDRPGETMTKAMEWGIKRAKDQVSVKLIRPVKRKRTVRRRASSA